MYTVAGIVQKSPPLGVLVLLYLSLVFARIFYQVLPMLFCEGDKKKEKVHPFMLILPWFILMVLVILTFLIPKEIVQKV
jgi:hydrogenase-4 component F